MKNLKTNYFDAKDIFLKLQKAIEMSLSKARQEASISLIFLMFRLNNVGNKLSIKEIINSHLEKDPYISRTKLEVKFSKLFKQGIDVGYFNKISSVSDRRVKYIELTKKGISYVQKIDKLFEKEWELMYG